MKTALNCSGVLSSANMLSVDVGLLGTVMGNTVPAEIHHTVFMASAMGAARCDSLNGPSGVLNVPAPPLPPKPGLAGEWLSGGTP